MKINYVPQKASSGDKETTYVRECVLESNKEVSDYIAMLAIFLQNGRNGIPLNSINSNLTRADLYKAPKTKHFNQHPGMTNPAVQYQQNLGLNKGNNFPLDNEDEFDSDDETDIYSSPTKAKTPGRSRNVPSATYTETPVKYIRNNEDYPSTSSNNLTPVKKVGKSNGQLTINPKSLNTPYDTACNSGDEDDANMFIPMRKVRAQSQSNNQTSLSSHIFQQDQVECLKTNIFGQQVPVNKQYLNPYRPPVSNSNRKETPTTHINSRLDRFRVITPVISFEQDQQEGYSGNFEDPFANEPSTPIEQTSEYKYSDAYSTPITTQKSAQNTCLTPTMTFRGKTVNSVSGTSDAHNINSFNNARKQKPALTSPFKTPERTVDGRVVKHRSASNMFNKITSPTAQRSSVQVETALISSGTLGKSRKNV